MDTTNLAVFDNTTEVTFSSHDHSENLQTITPKIPKTQLFFVIPKIPMSQTQSVGMIGLVIGFAIAIVGICANSAVLAVLIRARQQFGSSVNTLIMNQTVMDLLSCCFIVIPMILRLMEGGLVYGGSRIKIADAIVCILFDGSAVAGLCMEAGKIGLVVVTLERYFKIVHAIAHRKYYRDWMTKVGLALPWINGICWVLFPAIGTSRIVDGTCHRMAIWPNKAMASVSPIIIILKEICYMPTLTFFVLLHT